MSDVKPLTELEMCIFRAALNAYDDEDVITVDTLIAKIESLNAENAELRKALADLVKYGFVAWTEDGLYCHYYVEAGVRSI